MQNQITCTLVYVYSYTNWPQKLDMLMSADSVTRINSVTHEDEKGAGYISNIAAKQVAVRAGSFEPTQTLSTTASKKSL